jgi:hypothetical protein
MGIFRAWPMTQRPNRLMMTPEKISALRSFSISIMANYRSEILGMNDHSMQGSGLIFRSHIC